MEERYNALIAEFRELIAEYGKDGELDKIGIDLAKVCVTKISEEDDTIIFCTVFDDGTNVDYSINSIRCFYLDDLEMFYDELVTKLERTQS